LRLLKPQLVIDALTDLVGTPLSLQEPII
jgi:hypothetical protein